jgi:FkbM family methyltransferase
MRSLVWRPQKWFGRPSPTKHGGFATRLRAEIAACQVNNYGVDNWDVDRFGPYEETKSPQVDPEAALAAVDIEGLTRTFNLLADEYSRERLVNVWAYRLLGHRKVRLPLNNPDYWRQRDLLHELGLGREEIDIHFLGMKLQLTDLQTLGFKVTMFTTAPGAMNTFLLKQYEYVRGGVTIRAQYGDSVIDGGACYGDTSLFFAQRVGPAGKVYGFEFMRDNVEVYERNLAMNPNLAERITRVSEALWSDDGVSLHYVPFGPATTISGTTTKPASSQARGTTIDAFAQRANIDNVGFIKMDIEGSEFDALRGAEHILRRDKPRLAISVYHRDEDFVRIPAYLAHLNLGYRFYLDHFTIYGEETVLFATASAYVPHAERSRGSSSVS